MPLALAVGVQAMLAATPILDPRVWVEAFNAIPVGFKGTAIVLIIVWIISRYWGRRKNGS